MNISQLLVRALLGTRLLLVFCFVPVTVPQATARWFLSQTSGTVFPNTDLPAGEWHIFIICLVFFYLSKLTTHCIFRLPFVRCQNHWKYLDWADLMWKLGIMIVQRKAHHWIPAWNFESWISNSGETRATGRIRRRCGRDWLPWGCWKEHRFPMEFQLLFHWTAWRNSISVLRHTNNNQTGPWLHQKQTSPLRLA